MSLFRRSKSSNERRADLTRREIVALRRSQVTNSESVDGEGSYRRSRTLSASRPAALDSGSSERLALWQLRQKRRKLVAWLAGLIAAIGLIGFLISQLVVSVAVESPGVGRDDVSIYAGILKEYYSTRPIERLRFMTDRPAMQLFFQERAPEVQSVRVVGGGGLAKGVLQVSFRQPTLKWAVGGKSYFVDSLGITYEKNYFDDPGVSVDDQSGLSPDLGQEIINRRFLSFLGQAIALLREDGIIINQTILPPETIRQVELRVEGRPYRIKMTVDRGVEEQVAEAVHALKFIDERGLSPEYVDVRVDQRVFYK
ncbi:hypothetical protein B7Y94_01740 [Candidatus Saccharibacteria bacterium 32-49-12]|nr:MAG: hypothetical protein B7Y94_01740 [Candidatus Saccharibacteria bacterium 32-49-12]